jgi:hypothetical protein
MTEPDFRALCAELVRKWDAANGDHDLLGVAEAIDRARAALAQPEPQGPSDEELEDFALQNGGGYFNCDCQEEADILTRKHISNYRAVLARWGRPATTGEQR